MLLALPQHCSHLLQPFSKVAAQSLKSLIKKGKIDKESINFAKAIPSKAGMAYKLNVYLMIEIWRRVQSQVHKMKCVEVMEELSRVGCVWKFKRKSF